MLHRLPRFPAVLFTFFLLLVASGDASFTSSASPQTSPAKHGLTGSYYISTLESHSDVNPTGQDWYVQVWTDPNDFQLPRPFTAPAAVRVDPQIAFGQGKGFVMQNGEPTTWWPTGYAIPAGWTGWQVHVSKPWDPSWFAAVIWKGYIHLPKPGTYYLTTASKGASAVYLNQARVALNGTYGGLLVSDAFTYAKEDLRDYLQNLAYGREDLLFRAQPGDSYVVPVTVETPRNVAIEVRHAIGATLGVKNQPRGIDLFWVTPDSPRDASGKPVAQIVPGDVLYTEPPSPIEKPTVRGANSMLSADFLYFPAERKDRNVAVTVRLRDKDGHRVAGKRVHVGSLVSYGGADAIKQPEKPTDDKGETTANIRPGEGYKVTHDSTIFATDVTDLVDVAQVAHVTFQAGTVPTSFFADDAFSPYFAPDIIRVEPLPLIVGRPVTVSVALENRGKFPVELAATFRANDWAIGPAFVNEIGRVERIQLKPGEARRVSVQWTPGKAETHQCFDVVLTGRVLFGANPSGAGVVAAALLPTTNVVYASPPEANSIWQRIQTNLAGVNPDYKPCEEWNNDAAPGVSRNVNENQWDYQNRAHARHEAEAADLWQKAQDAHAAGDTHKAADLAYKAQAYRDAANCVKHEELPTKAEAKADLPGWKNLVERWDREYWRNCLLETHPDTKVCNNIELDISEDTADIVKLQDIIRDPPEASYRRLAIAASDSPLAFLDVMRISLERYQGAQDASDTEWMARHFTAIGLYEKRLADSLRRKAADLEKKAQSLPPDNPQDLAARQAELEKHWAEIIRGDVIPTDRRQKLLAAGFTEAGVNDMVQQLRSLKQPPKLEGLRAMLLDSVNVHKEFAEHWAQLSEVPASARKEGEKGTPRYQTYAVGNPHDKEETLDLFIRPVSIPVDWKLSIVNAGKTEGRAQAPKWGDAPPKFPVVEREPGKHYAVTLPAKTQVQVTSVVLPVGEVGANTIARWAVEGKIGDELIGGMVHEMNVPYVIADLKLPAVGSKEEEEEVAQPPRKGLSSALLIAAAGGLLIFVVIVFVILKRRRRPEAPAAP